MFDSRNVVWKLPRVEERQDWKSLTKVTAPMPEPGPKEVLIQVHAVSLNYRDLVIANRTYPGTVQEHELVPASDGAGVARGASQWKPGDRVVAIFNMIHLYGSRSSRGRALARRSSYAVLPETALLPIPECLSFEEAATLPCAAVTAYNGLYGIASQALRPGQTVLVQGTGGVRVFTLQIALAAGANLIATSSSSAET
ncbi:hypothetical protein OC861_005487 [Tilletia horrida]|nr:hypothetical protein OC861_005487 [Tilletia horrida]